MRNFITIRTGVRTGANLVKVPTQQLFGRILYTYVTKWHTLPLRKYQRLERKARLLTCWCFVSGLMEASLLLSYKSSYSTAVKHDANVSSCSCSGKICMRAFTHSCLARSVSARWGLRACFYPEIQVESMNGGDIGYLERVLQLIDVVVNKFGTVTLNREYSTEGNAGVFPYRGGAFGRTA